MLHHNRRIRTCMVLYLLTSRLLSFLLNYCLKLERAEHLRGRLPYYLRRRVSNLRKRWLLPLFALLLLTVAIRCIRSEGDLGDGCLSSCSSLTALFLRCASTPWGLTSARTKRTWYKVRIPHRSCACRFG